MGYSPLNTQNGVIEAKATEIIVAEPAVAYAVETKPETKPETKETLPPSIGKHGINGNNMPDNINEEMHREVAKRKEGRMSLFTPDKVAAILEGIENGKTMKVISAEIGITRTTIWTWMQLNQEFANLVAQAREFQAHAYADDAVNILDNVVIDPEQPKVAMAELRKAEQQARIRTNLAECFNFSQYGKKQQNLNLNVNAEVSPVDLSKYGFKR